MHNLRVFGENQQTCLRGFLLFVHEKKHTNPILCGANHSMNDSYFQVARLATAPPLQNQNPLNPFRAKFLLTVDL